MCPGAGMPMPIRWQVRRWRCREQACGGGDVLRAKPSGLLPSRPAGGANVQASESSAVLRGHHDLVSGLPAQHNLGV